MNSKFHILAALFFVLILFAVPASAAGPVEIDLSERAVYANGVPIIITGDSSQTHLSYAGYSGSDDITGYSVYGGSKDNSYGANGLVVMTTSVTVQGGTVGPVYGGNRGDSSEEVSLNTNVVISGGTAGPVYGGNQNGTLNNSILSVSYTGGAVSTVYGGSENGAILNSQLDLFVKDALNTADSNLNTLYGGSDNGHILTTGLTKSEIHVSVQRSVISALYGGSRVGNIDGDISVSVSDSNISSFHGGSLGGYLGGVSGSGIVGHSHYGNIYGNISSRFYNSSGSVAFGASAFGEVFGNVTFHLNACPVCDEGETETLSHVCLNSVPGVKHSFNTVVGGGGDSIWATRYSEINYGNVYGDVKLVVAGDTNIGYRLMAGGRQGNTRLVPDPFGNPTGDGGNVTMILKGNTSFYWSCAAGYYSYKGLVTEGDVNVIVGGNVTCTQLNGGGEFGGVGGEITITVKENAKLPTIYGGTSDHWWWSGDGPDETTDKKVTVIVEGGNTDYILSNSRGYLKEFNVIMNSGTVGSIYGGGGFSYAHTDTANIYLNGGNVSYVYAGGYDSTTYLKKKTTIFVNESIGRISGLTVPTIYGGGGPGSYTGSSEINVGGSKLHSVYGGGFGRTESSVVNIAAHSEILTVMGGGDSGSAVNTTKINVTGGTVETLYGGGDNMTVNNSSVTVSGGQIGSFCLGGTHDPLDPAGVSHVVNSVLTLSGGEGLKRIYGSGESQTDTVGNVIIHLYDTKAKDYWYYLDSDSLANADLRIIRHGALVSYDVVEVTDPLAEHSYLFPYTLSFNESKEEPKTPSNTSGGNRLVPGSAPGNADNSSGFETKVDDAGMIIVVFLFPLAVAAFCFSRREGRD